MIDPPGPPTPIMQPGMLHPTPNPLAMPTVMPGMPNPLGGMPSFPVSVVPVAPAANAAKPKKPKPLFSPFGNNPLNVTATASNVAQPAAAPAAHRSANQAALELLAYVTPILAAHRGSELGVKNAPNPVVKAAQLDMNDVPADGIYGPRTRAKGTALTGKKFPPRV
jgi:hypothetical protein